LAIKEAEPAEFDRGRGWFGVRTMGNHSVKQLATAIPGNLRLLASLIARKPSTFSPDWASTVDQAFSLYTRTRTVNMVLSNNDLLAEANWPFPAYLDLKKEVDAPSLKRLLAGKPLPAFRTLYALLARKPLLCATLLLGITQNKEWRRNHISTNMVLFFWVHSKEIFQYWEQSSLLRGKEPIVQDIRRTFRKGYWAACIPTALALLDYLMRKYFQTTKLNVSIQTLRDAFEKARILPKDLKPGYAIWKGAKDPDQGNTFVTSIEEDLRLPGVLLSSFVEFANAYYGWYTVESSNSSSVLNRHAIMHCAADYWTIENTVKLLTFFDLTLRLEPALQVVIHGPSALPRSGGTLQGS
jgi:hypothetical protein